MTSKSPNRGPQNKSSPIVSPTSSTPSRNPRQITKGGDERQASDSHYTTTSSANPANYSPSQSSKLPEQGPPPTSPGALTKRPKGTPPVPLEDVLVNAMLEGTDSNLSSRFESETSSEQQDSSSPYLVASGYSSALSSVEAFDMRNDFFEDLAYKEAQEREASKLRLCQFVWTNIVGYDQVFSGPFGSNIITYVDYIASGKPLKCIETYIRKHVMPVYANTHTEVSHTAQQTQIFRQEARDIIREAVHASDDDAVIFVGSGATSAINKLIFALKLKNPIVFIGPYEHHSNMLPWLEINAKVVRIPQTKDGLIDIQRLHMELQSRCCRFRKRTLIGTFSVASNITGIMTDVDAVTSIIHKFNGIVFFDYACAAPYVEIDMNPETKDGPEGFLYKDAIFISPHKYVGGPGSPGVLVAKRYLFNNPVPHNAGGGTVNFVRRKTHRYLVDPEHREEGGTPAIIESIRAGLTFKLKQAFTADFIMDMEENFYRKAIQIWGQTENLLVMGNHNVMRLPIFPLMFYNPATGRFVHQNFIAIILNDVFGIQARSGCACAGPYSMDLLGMCENMASRLEDFLIRSRSDMTLEQRRKDPFTNSGYKPGFVRLNFPYFMSPTCFSFVINAVNMVAKHGWALMPQYDFDRHTGVWRHKVYQRDNKDHLQYISFETGAMEVNPDVGRSDDDDVSTAEIKADTYKEILERAQQIFKDALMGAFDDDGPAEYEGEAEKLRWFMLPREAANIIHNRPVRQIPTSELPFFPGALARKLGVAVVGHKARSRSMDKNFPLEYN